jgi:hypothetical protein
MNQRVQWNSVPDTGISVTTAKLDRPTQSLEGMRRQPAFIRRVEPGSSTVETGVRDTCKKPISWMLISPVEIIAFDIDMDLILPTRTFRPMKDNASYRSNIANQPGAVDAAVSKSFHQTGNPISAGSIRFWSEPHIIIQNLGRDILSLSRNLLRNGRSPVKETYLGAVAFVSMKH